MRNKDQEFKDEAVQLALTSSQSIAQTAKALGIKENTLYNWVHKAKMKAGHRSGANTSEANLIEELNRLRKENARLKEEREILKKAAAFFAREAK